MLDRRRDTQGSASKHLHELAQRVVEGVERTGDGEGPRRSAFAEELRLIDREVEELEFVREEVRSFLRINQFALTFGVEWYTLG
jgi:hypothetical protein